MAKSKVAHKLIPDEEKEMTELQTYSNPSEEYDERPFDQEFWRRVGHIEYQIYNKQINSNSR